MDTNDFIQIQGLTKRQVALCKLLWSMDHKDQCDALIKSLSKEDQLTCLSLMHMMELAYLDQVDDTELADRAIIEILEKFDNK
jgi:hypothetical protein